MRAIFLVMVGFLVLGCTGTPPASNNTTMPPGYEVADYCESDDDCLRQQSCCDCGLGEYVNRYHYNNTTCTGPVCKCAIQPSRGDCQGNRCVAVPVDAPPPAGNTTGVPPGYEAKDYCEADGDCVRLNRCCDCGPGEYVNRYHQVEALCADEPACMCPQELTHGECEENRCIAVADSVGPKPPAEEKVSIFSGHGECGSPENPKSVDSENGLTFRGRVGAPNPCHTASAIVKKISTGDDHYYVLNMTTRPTDAEICVKCLGYVPWEINITGYWGRVDIYYGSQKVFPDKAGFCGWDTDASCSSDADCMEGGCSGQVCQGKGDEPVVTTCEWKGCYDNTAYGVGCGCIGGKCGWN